MAYRFLRLLARLVVLAQMRLRVTGAEHVPRTGAVLLICNHLGLTDPLPVAACLPRELRMLSKAELFEWPVIGGLARMARAVPIRRGESDREALRALTMLLGDAQCVLVFPEGTYVDPPEPAVMLPFKTGAAWLALKTGTTVVPVALTGTDHVWAPLRGWRPWQRTHVSVTFGEPYTPEVPAGLHTRAALLAITDDMARRVAALLPEEYRGHYSQTAAVEPTTASRPTSAGAHP